MLVHVPYLLLALTLAAVCVACQTVPVRPAPTPAAPGPPAPNTSATPAAAKCAHDGMPDGGRWLPTMGGGLCVVLRTGCRARATSVADRTGSRTPDWADARCDRRVARRRRLWAVHAQRRDRPRHHAPARRRVSTVCGGTIGGLQVRARLDAKDAARGWRGLSQGHAAPVRRGPETGRQQGRPPARVRRGDPPTRWNRRGSGP